MSNSAFSFSHSAPLAFFAPHCKRYSALRSMQSTTSWSLIRVTTCVPQNGGVGTGTSRRVFERTCSPLWLDLPSSASAVRPRCFCFSTPAASALAWWTKPARTSGSESLSIVSRPSKASLQ